MRASSAARLVAGHVAGLAWRLCNMGTACIQLIFQAFPLELLATRYADLNLNPRQAIRTQQQRQFAGVGQVVVEETPDRLQDRYLLLGDSVGG